MKMPQRYEGLVAVVTGAGSGIGAATARRLHAEGAAVVLFGRRESKLREVAGPLGARTLVVPGDISIANDARGLIEKAVHEFGQIDLLVNNAGVGAFGPFVDAGAQEWRRVMATNLDGLVEATQAAIPHLLTTRGSVVNVSSVSGLGGDWGMSVYNASKGAVSNLTRALALEFGRRGVRFNAVAPSLTETEMTAGFTDPKLLAKFMDRIPAGRAAQPEDIASVIAFLGSADAGFVNGVVLPVDGGAVGIEWSAEYGVCRRLGRKSLLFLKKRSKKTFDSWCRAGCRSLRAQQSDKVFCFFFSKKKFFLTSAFAPLASPVHAPQATRTSVSRSSTA